MPEPTISATIHRVVSPDNDVMFREVADMVGYAERQGRVDRIFITPDLHPDLLLWPEHFEGSTSNADLVRCIYGELWGYTVARLPGGTFRTLSISVEGELPEGWNLRPPMAEGTGRTVWDRLNDA